MNCSIGCMVLVSSRNLTFDRVIIKYASLTRTSKRPHNYLLWFSCTFPNALISAKVSLMFVCDKRKIKKAITPFSSSLFENKQVKYFLNNERYGANCVIFYIKPRTGNVKTRICSWGEINMNTYHVSIQTFSLRLTRDRNDPGKLSMWVSCASLSSEKRAKQTHNEGRTDIWIHRRQLEIGGGLKSPNF